MKLEKMTKTMLIDVVERLTLDKAQINEDLIDVVKRTSEKEKVLKAQLSDISELHDAALDQLNSIKIAVETVRFMKYGDIMMLNEHGTLVCSGPSLSKPEEPLNPKAINDLRFLSRILELASRCN